MKPKASLRTFLALSGSVFLIGIQAHAAYLYWDTNSTTGGLGTTAGTWGSSTFMHSVTNPEARGIFEGTLATAATATALADTITFGTINLALSGSATTVTVSGTQNIGNITFGLAQTNAMALTGGTITFTGAGTIYALAPGTTQTISSTITGAATSLTKGGQGTLLLTGTNSFAGAMIVTSGGTLQVGNGTTGSLSATNALTFNAGGGTFNVAEAAGSTEAMGALTFSAGEGTVQSSYGGSGNTTLSFTSLAARTAGATGNFVVSGGTNGSSNKIVLTGAGTGSLLDKGIFFDGGSYAAYDAGGFVRAFGSGDTGFVSIGAGTDMGARATTDNVSLTGSLTAQTATAVNTINLGANSIAMDAAGTDLVLQANGLLSNGSGSATIGGGTTPRLQSTTAGGEMVIRVNGSSDALDISSIVQNNTSASALTKSGAGTLTLSGANTYTGTTRINTGILALSGGSAIADTGAVILADAAGATLKLNASETIGNLSGGGFSGGNVDVQGNTLTFGDSGNQTFGGRFIGTSSGAITKQGAGTVTLNNANTFAGTINLNAGTLALGLGNSHTTLLQTISSGGAINISGGATFSVIPAVQVALGQATNNNPSQLSVPGGFVISNNINITSGTANFRASGNGTHPIYSGNVTGGTSGSQTLSVLTGIPSTATGDGQVFLFSGVIQDGSGGTLGLSVDFNNSQTTGTSQSVNFSGQNTFTGPISVANTKLLTGGAFLVIGGERISNSATTGVTAGSGSLGTTTPGTGNYSNTISLATGTILDYASSANQTLSGQISGSGAILKEGAGTLTLSGPSTFNFVLPGGTPALTTGVAIRAGTLSVGSLNSVVGGSASSHLGAPTTVAGGTIAIGNTVTAGQLTYTGAGEITDRVINLAGTTGGATIDQSGVSGLLKFTSNLTATGGGIKTLTLQGSTDGTGEIGGAIVDNTLTNKTSVTKTGSGKWTLSGDNSYSGATNINGGTLVVSGGGDINQTTGVTIASSATFRYNSSVAYTGGTITNNGGTIAGTGDIGVSVALNSTSDILAPGNSPGIQEYTIAQSWDSFTYQWEVNDFNGTTAGTDYDQIQITGGDLTLSGASAGSYILDLTSLAGLVAGNVADFSETTTSWNILTASGGITGFNPAYWTIDHSTGPNIFTSSPAWTGTWSLSLNDTLGTDNLVLTYTAVPEPRAALLGSLGLLALLRRRRA